MEVLSLCRASIGQYSMILVILFSSGVEGIMTIVIDISFGICVHIQSMWDEYAIGVTIMS